MLGLLADRDWLSFACDIAQAATGIVAVVAGFRFLQDRRSRRTVIQRYLVGERNDAEKPGGNGSGARSIIHLMGRCSMTEAQVLEAAFENSNIKTWVATDPDTGLADTLLFRIDDKAWPKLKNSN
ncbi:hypothetical protein [Mesorhizobium sp. LSJC285A00]|uniref:hypothetical protein n=1 Tax=Mesorhizobium sp. LSJC285A00 TaxID=1287338 RepID=UPI0012EBC3DD|nr:hypothetical protein [Mesorhizobium sp. LSJC285A00]